MLEKKLKQIFLLCILYSTMAWSTNQDLNGILTFDEYNNHGSNRTGVTSFEFIDGKETNAYKVVTGKFPYAHKSGDILYGQGCGLSLVREDGFSKSVVPCPPKERSHQFKYEHSQLSPSKLFVAVESSNYKQNTRVMVFDIKGNEIKTYQNCFAPTWLPDGRLLVSSSGNRYGLFVTDKSFKSISKIDNNKLQEYAYNPDVSPSGKRVVFEYNQQIWIMNMDGTKLKRLLRGSKRLKYPTWSPDGKYIAYLRQDSRKYYDEAIYFFEVDGEHKQSSLSTRKVYEAGETGYPDIAGPLSWIANQSTNTTSSKKKISNDKTMPDIKKVGYSKESFSDLIELLEFSLGRKMTQAEKVAWVKSDYQYSRGDFQNRQQKMKKVLEKFSAMNSEIQKIKDEKYTKLIQKYMQEYFVMSYAKAPIETSNGMVAKLLNEDNLLAINIQKKEYATVPVEFNKNSVVKNAIGYTNLNVKKLKKSQWGQRLAKVHDAKKLKSIDKIRNLFSFMPNTKATGRIESWNEGSQSYIYYAKENPLSHWGEHIKIDQNHYKLKFNGLPITLKPWGYTFYDEIKSADSFDDTAPMYMMDTSNIEKGYRYLLNGSYIFNIGFDLNAKSPSDFQRELMSHINRMRFKLDGDKTPKINFDLWFNDKKYASTFMFLLKLKKIELKANYSHKTVDEWLLENLVFKQEGKHVYIDQIFTQKLSDEFITRVTDEIKIFQN